MIAECHYCLEEKECRLDEDDEPLCADCHRIIEQGSPVQFFLQVPDPRLFSADWLMAIAIVMMGWGFLTIVLG